MYGLICVSVSVVIMRGFLPSDAEHVRHLEGELRRVKERITRVFLLEIKDGIRGAHMKIDKLLHEDDRKLLERLIPPKEIRSRASCLSGTREAVIDEIVHWNREIPPHDSRLLLLLGVAGCGKSSVAGTVCERLGKQLTGSFFCARDDADRRNPVRLIWALAYYLAFKDSSYRAIC